MELHEEVTSSKRIYEGRIVNLRVDDVMLGNGKTSKREVVEHGGAIAVVAMPDPQTVILVRQFRLPAEGTLLEIVAGGLEEGESPEVSARRELTEEIAYTCGQLIPLYEAWVAPGYTTEKIYGYLALDLSEEKADMDEDENIEIVTMSLSDALAAISDGRIQDMKTVAGLTMAERYLRQQG